MAYPLTYTPEPSKPSGGPTPGAKALLSFCIGEFDVAVKGDEISSLGIYNPRDVCGNSWPNWRCKGSQHARGAALDAGVPVVRPQGHTEGHRLAAWLVTHHAALGVQEVIWAGRRWHNRLGVIPHAQWPKYTGRSDHFDHVHVALNAPAAEGLTHAQIQAVWANHPAPQEDDPMAAFTREEIVGPLNRIEWLLANSVLNLLKQIEADEAVDVDTLASALAPLLKGTVTEIGNDDLDAIAKAVADEQSRRLAS